MKKYEIIRANQPLVLDGIIEKEFWKEAKEVSLSETLTGEAPKQATVAKLLYDDEYLYVGFVCVDDEIVAEMTEYNDCIYDEEVVEIFLSTGDDINQYTELEVSPINTLLHYYIRLVDQAPRGYARVEKVVETAVQQRGNLWSVEMRIPLKELTDKIVGSGTVWKGNLYRIDRRETGDDEYSAWSPTKEIAFHRPQYFGEFVFV